MDECTAALSAARAFHPRGQRHRGTETRRSRQVIRELGGTKAASVSDWPTLCGKDRTSIAVGSFSGLYRRLADAVVSEGTTMLKAPALSHTDDAIEDNISEIFPKYTLSVSEGARPQLP